MGGIVDLAQKTMTDVISRVKSTDKFKDRTVFQVYDVLELLGNVGAGFTLPAVGVVYEGLRSFEKGQRDSHRTGMESEIIVSLLLMYRLENIGPTKNHTVALNMLDTLRQVMMDTRGPSGHFYRFVTEAALGSKSNTIVWQQRWACPCILSPG